MQEPIEVHYWPTPNGHKVTIALEEMGLPYAIKPVNIGRGEQFTPDFLAISPNNRMPAIVDPDGPGAEPIAVFESGAILQYLGRKTGRFYPSDERARVKVDEWVHWQMANLGPNAGQRNHFRNYAPTFIFDQRADCLRREPLHQRGEQTFYGVLNTRKLRGPRLHCRRLHDRRHAQLALGVRPRRAGHHDRRLSAHQKLRHARVAERPAVQRALAAAAQVRAGGGLQAGGREAAEARKILFGQRARA